jgi:hypothetical protein
MTKEIRQYIAKTEGLLKENSPDTDWNSICADMLTRIGFYQHERLIHLIVTVLFSLMLILCLAATTAAWQFGIAAAALMVLEIPYILHYFFLENSTQKLYKLYYAAQEKLLTNKDLQSKIDL